MLLVVFAARRRNFVGQRRPPARGSGAARVRVRCAAPSEVPVTPCAASAHVAAINGLSGE